MQTGDIIKFLRTQEGLTQDDMAELLGVKKSSIQKYESGAVSNLKMNTLRTICEKFGLSPYVLVFPEKVGSFDVAMRFHFSDEDAQHLLNMNEEGIDKILKYAKDLYDSGNYRIK